MAESLGFFSQVKMLVVGDVMLDRYLWSQVGRISPEAPVPIARILEKTSALGGAANVAANLAGLGVHVFLLGVKGDDEAGKILSERLFQSGIEDHLLVDEQRPTTKKTRLMAQGQQLVRLDEERTGELPADKAADLMGRFEELLPEAGGVILSDYGKGVLSQQICRRVIDRSGARGIPVFVDPKGRDWKRYGRATCITPNEAELKEVARAGIATEEDLFREAAEIKERHGFQYLVVTRGAKGMAILDPGGGFNLIPAKPREVFDVSGAGDTVVAVLAAAVAGGLDWKRAASLANVAAGVVVGKVGTHAIRLDELQIAVRLDETGYSFKLFSFQDAKAQVDCWRAVGERIVFTNGCFDLLHAGHVKLLHEAAKQGSKLIVGLNSDSSVRRLKGPGRPILNQHDRASILSALQSVDMVVLFDEETPLNLIRAFRPHVLVKGADYRKETVVGHELVESWGGEVVLIPLAEGSSTTSIVRSIQKNSVG